MATNTETQETLRLSGEITGMSTNTDTEETLRLSGEITDVDEAKRQS